MKRPDPEYHTLLILTFGISFLICFPNFIYSIDEISYYAQALALSQGEVDLIYPTVNHSNFIWDQMEYPLGTSSILALFLLISPKLSSVPIILYSLLGLLYCSKATQNLNLKPWMGLVPVLIYLPFLFFSRSFMSEMPSFLIISFLLYLVSSKSISIRKIFWIGFVFSISVWFRELNLILCLGLIWMIKSELAKNWIPFVIGTALGFSLRLISAKLIYEDLFHIKNNAGFGFEYLLENMGLYLLFLVILLPGALYVLVSKSRYKFIQMAIGIYIILHLFYGYNALEYSGFFTSIFYGGRFLIPALPLFAILYAEKISKISHPYQPKLNKIVTYLAMLVVLVGSALMFFQKKGHQQIAQQVLELSMDRLMVFNESEYRYINPSMGHCPNFILSAQFMSSPIKYLEERDALFVISTRSNSQGQHNAYQKKIDVINQLKVIANCNQIEDKTLRDKTRIQIWEIKRR